MFTRTWRSFRPTIWPVLMVSGMKLSLGFGEVHAETPLSQKVPGVYIWGDNRTRLISSEAVDNIRLPSRVPWFDGKYLRDLCVTPDVAAAVLANGDCIEWTKPDNQHRILRGVVQVRSASSTLVALTKSGTIYTWKPVKPEMDYPDSQKPQPLRLPRDLGWFEKIVQIETGADHVVALTSKGRVLTGLINDVKKHRGQLGTASYPAFDPAPESGELRLVRLLEKHKVTEIASGLNHVLFRTNENELLGCGANDFGQLMLPYSFRNVSVSVPMPLPAPQVVMPESAKGLPKVHVAAGGNVTYFVTENEDHQRDTFVAGNGEHGQFATGSFSQCQVSPLRIAALGQLREFDEIAGAVVPIFLRRFSVGPTHTFAQLSNGDWLVWGSGDRGQLGSNKLSRLVKPQFVKRLPLGEYIGPENVFVAGKGISSCYTEA